MNNSRGSIPLVIIVVLSSLFTIFILTNLLTIEKNAHKRINSTVNKDLYPLNSAIELMVNITQQKMVSKEQPFKQGTFYFLDSSDMVEIETAMNESISPFLLEKMKVDIKKMVHTKSLDTLCEENFEPSSYTNEKEFVGVDCDATFFDIKLEVDFQTKGMTQSLNITFKDVYPEESAQGNIALNLSNLTIDISI